MALTSSTMVNLGSTAPDFSLQDPSGKMWCLNDFNDAKALLVIFMCNHCPYVIHLEQALAEFAKEYQAKGIAILGINANDVSQYADDAPEEMAKKINEVGYSFPYLFDESQSIAKAYSAACTPDFFLFDEARKLVYRGQFDGSRPGNNLPITGEDLRYAIDNLLSEQPVSTLQKPSIGCNIKWKKGNEPEYF